jgi:DNA-binding beta-propeller fold protein YncE
MLFICMPGCSSVDGSAAPGVLTNPSGGRCSSESLALATPDTGLTEPDDAAAGATPGAESILTVIAEIPLPGGASRFDYQSFDPASGRLWIAHMGAGQVIVFDTARRSVVGTVEGLPTVTGVLAVPEHHRVYAAVAGDHQVAVIDDQTLVVMARLGEMGFPDGLAYAPETGRVFVSDESSGRELVIDTTSDSVVTTIDLGGEAGNTHYDAGSGCIVVAVQSRNELAFIDPVADQVDSRIELDADCEGPHGFLIDAPRRLAFATCEDNVRLLVVDLITMGVTATYDIGDGPDVLAFDPGLQWLYVASEAGVVSVFAEQRGALQAIGEYRAPHAHSVAVDPTTHLVYLPLESVNGAPVLRILKPEP